MLAIEKSRCHTGKCTANVLPCRIKHNGAVDASKRYWNPSETPDGKRVAYFRGRKLHGKRLKVPEGYRGVVLSSTSRVLPKDAPSQGMAEDDEEDMEETPEVKIMEEQSGFDDIIVWGHEALPDDSTDPYVKGVEEWFAVAEQIHTYEPEEEAGIEKSK